MWRAGAFRAALSGERPFEDLYELAAAMVRQGRQRRGLMEDLHQLSTALQVEGHREAGAIVLRVMDCVGWWCAPEMRI